ncbi:hypothetical protein RRG08_041041 [Elysia crispata]|uniref:Uncharacterized protein n=1 Tax=Elysia crispata TaxID=231223 RepID=A0AAE0Y826_9GAST|nr:hypothetical protein RRG08_041041 [Elysia crispata]
MQDPELCRALKFSINVDSQNLPSVTPCRYHGQDKTSGRDWPEIYRGAFKQESEEALITWHKYLRSRKNCQKQCLNSIAIAQLLTTKAISSFFRAEIPDSYPNKTMGGIRMNSGVP